MSEEQKLLDMKKDEEMRDTFIAISVIAKRMADRIQQKMYRNIMGDLQNKAKEGMNHE